MVNTWARASDCCRVVNFLGLPSSQPQDLSPALVTRAGALGLLRRADLPEISSQHPGELQWEEEPAHPVHPRMLGEEGLWRGLGPRFAADRPGGRPVGVDAADLSARLRSQL